ncbi:thrombopoietin receptor [Anguilla anguilla]|uniref:thrombopoietin receptor n=1 Tax=Anguilla anguilla TaxID=7936 RepID=UPI0015AC74F6|nr:thrombopoietin receptor [Anguilla anguilla]
MDLRHLRWKIYIWTQAQICFGLVLGSVTGSINQLSKKDIVLLEADEDPKCFTRTQYDLTCFWEESNNKSYNFFYSIDDEEKLCNLTQQKMDNTTIVHICSFPPFDVYLFTLIHIRVVETSTNTTMHRRNISVEDQVLFYSPTNVSLHVTEEAGQLQVTWCMPEEWRDKAHYELKYSSHSLEQKTEQVKTTKSLVYRLNSLVPGEVCSVQMRVIPNGYGMRGHWSDWSHPTMAMVPQNAGDIDLLCHTSDLRNIQCQWKERASGENYTLFYKLCPRSSGQWRECTHRENASQCAFPGEESSPICVNIGGHGPYSRLFYSEPFRMNDSVKTDPPQKLRAETEGGRLCLQWDPPLQNLSRLFMYEIRYRPQRERLWKFVTLQSSETGTCLDFQAGSQYAMQIRAKPDGSMYSGFWSDWSSTLTVDVPSNIATLLVACIPFMVFLVPVLLIAIFSKHFRKIKQHLWPPVPNLDKVLEGFLIDINQNCQNPSFSIKQCYEDTITSVVEIVSEKEALLCGKIQREPITNSLSEPEPEEQETAEEHTEILEASQDYVTLNAESLTPCLWGNEYVYDQSKTQSTGEEVLQMRCHCSCASSTDIFNQSYLLLSRQPKVPQLRKTAGGANQYTNLESMAQPTPVD